MWWAGSRDFFKFSQIGNKYPKQYMRHRHSGKLTGHHVWPLAYRMAPLSVFLKFISAV